MNFSPALQKRILSALILGPLVLTLIIMGGTPYLAFVAIGSGISLYELYKMEQQGNHLVRNVALETIYIAICAAAFVQLRLGYENGLYLMLAVMLTVWASDTGAYMAGKSIGGPKMCPRLSPNKTWAGLIGGMLASGLTLMLFDLAKDISSAHSIVIFLTGFVLGAVGQAGDLLISSVKRRVGVKDTGHIIPGHGGILDRIDALLLVVPTFLPAHWLWL